MDSDSIKFLLAILTIVVITIVFACCFAFLLEKSSCCAQAKKMNVEHDYGILKGCMIKINNKWIPLQNYREIE